MKNVLVTPPAQKDFDGLPLKVQGQVAKAIEMLRNFPAVGGVKALKGRWAGTYRKRSGDYRLLFVVEGNRLKIIRIDDRKDVYD